MMPEGKLQILQTHWSTVY